MALWNNPLERAERTPTTGNKILPNSGQTTDLVNLSKQHNKTVQNCWQTLFWQQRKGGRGWALLSRINLGSNPVTQDYLPTDIVESGYKFITIPLSLRSSGIENEFFAATTTVVRQKLFSDVFGIVEQSTAEGKELQRTQLTRSPSL